MLRGFLGFVGVLLFVSPLGACASEEAAARTTAERFYTAVERKDGQAACELLSDDTVDALEQSEGSPCEDAAVKLDLSGSRVREVQVFSGAGIVIFDGGDRAFLTEESGGWRVSAAGCRVDEDAAQVPHQCSVEA